MTGALGVLSDRSTWLRIGLPLLLLKVFLLLFVLLSRDLLPLPFDRATYFANFHWPAGTEPTVATLYKTWDAQHYLYLSEHGYNPDNRSVAFYPLWPFLIRLGSYVCGGSYLLSGLLLANLFSLLAFLLLYAVVKEQWGEPAAGTSVLLLVAYPGSLFLLFPYTESLFLFLSLLFFYYLSRDRVAAASMVAFLLPLTRAVGIFIALPLAYCLFQQWRRDAAPAGVGGAGRPPAWTVRRALRDLCLLASPVLGWAAYFLIMWLSVGDPLSGVRAQKELFITERSAANVLDVRLLVDGLLNVGIVKGRPLHGMLDSTFDRLWFLLLLACLVPLWRMSKVYFLFAVGVGIVPVMTGSFMGYTRYVLVVFPLFIVLGRFFSAEGRQKYGWTLAGILFALQLLFLIKHTSNHWIG